MKNFFKKHLSAFMLVAVLAAVSLPAFATIGYSVAVRNAQLDAIESTIGTSAIMEIRTGSPPANCAASNTGSVLATLSLGSDWMAAASSGSKAKNGTWQDTSADGTGTADHFRIFASDGTTCGIQGTVGTSGSDINLQNDSIASGQAITITSFSITAGNP